MEAYDLSQNLSLQKLASEGDYEQLQELLQSQDYDQQLLDQALRQAVSKFQSTTEHFDCIEALINAGASVKIKHQDQSSLLMQAARLGKIDLAEFLINQGCELNERDDQGQTPLMYAIESQYGDNADVVELLIQSGANIHNQDKNGNTALHYAGRRGYFNTLKSLIENGAFIDQRNKESETALHIAVKQGHEKCVQLLRSSGANLHSKNIAGHKPIDYAQGELQAMLQEKAYKRQRKPQRRRQTSIVEIQQECFQGNCGKCGKGLIEILCAGCCKPTVQLENVEVQTELDLQKENFKEEIRLLKENIKVYQGQIQQSNKKIGLLEQQQKLGKKNNKQIDQLQKQVKRLKCDIQGQQAEQKSYLNQIEQLQKKINFDLSYYQIPQTKTDNSNLIQQLDENCIQFGQQLSNWQTKMDTTYKRTIQFINDLIQEIDSSLQVKIFGSYQTQLHLPTSDLDIVIIGTNVQLLDTLELHMQCHKNIKESFVIWTARVPVLKSIVMMDKQEIRIDISTNDNIHRGIQCVDFVQRMIMRYSQLRDLTLIMKQFFKIHGFNETFSGGISSYAIFIMTLSFIQFQGQSKSIGDTLFKMIQYYSIVFQYDRPVYAYDPDITQQLMDIQYDYQCLVIPEPLNINNNLCHNTRLDILIDLYRMAYYNMIN